jgi:long-subunit fatty acid transport protein
MSPRPCRWRATALTLLACLTLWGSAALGQEIDFEVELNLSGSGARATGMGGAFIGVADDATAAMWNPAGLTQLELPEVSVVAKVVVDQADLGGFGDVVRLSETDSGHGAFDFGSAVYPIRLGERKLVISVSYQRLLDFFNSRVLFLREGAAALNVRGGVSAIAPGFALRPVGPLAIGGSLNFWYGDLSLNQTTVAPELSDSTFHSNLDTDLDGINTTLGLLLDLESIWPSLPAKVGGVYRRSFDLEFESRLRNRLGRTPVRDESFEDEIEMMRMLGIGGSVRVQEYLTLAADFERLHFPHDTFNLAPTDTLPANSGPSNDENEYRVGAEYTLVRERFVFPLRCGFRAIPFAFEDEEERGPEVSTTWVAAVGAGFATAGYSIDGALETRWRTEKAVSGDFTFRQYNIAFSTIIYF